MALFIDDIERLSKELKNRKPGQMPTMLSLVIMLFSAFVALVLALVFVFPILGIFHFGIISRLVLTIAAFIIIGFIIGGLIAYASIGRTK